MDEKKSEIKTKLENIFENSPHIPPLCKQFILDHYDYMYDKYLNLQGYINGWLSMKKEDDEFTKKMKSLWICNYENIRKNSKDLEFLYFIFTKIFSQNEIFSVVSSYSDHKSYDFITDNEKQFHLLWKSLHIVFPFIPHEKNHNIITFPNFHFDEKSRLLFEIYSKIYQPDRKQNYIEVQIPVHLKTYFIDLLKNQYHFPNVTEISTNESLFQTILRIDL